MPLITTLQEEREKFEKAFNSYETDYQRGILGTFSKDADSGVTIRSFFAESQIRLLESLKEESKRVQGDPFTNSEEFLDGMAMFKYKVIILLDSAINEIKDDKK